MELREHMNEMNAGGILKQILCYHPWGWRSIRCPLKRWEENI